MATVLQILSEVKDLIQKDPDFRQKLQSIVHQFAPSHADFQKLIESLDKRFEALQKEMHQGFAKMDERFAKLDDRFAKMDDRFAKMDERFAKMDERFAKIDERFAKMDERFEALTKEMIERFAKVDEKFEEMKKDNQANTQRIISTLGSRWGIRTESYLRNVLRHVVRKNFGGNIERVFIEDSEIDIVASNSNVMVIEMCARVKSGDLNLLIKKGKLIEKEKKKKPELVLATAEIHLQLAKRAEKMGITIITSDIEDDE